MLEVIIADNSNTHPGLGMNKVLKRFHSDVIVYDSLSFTVALNLIKNVFRLLFYLLRIGISMTLASPFSSPIVRTIPHGESRTA